MTTTTHRQFFGDQERDFTLTMPHIRELERQTGTGIGTLARRTLSGDFAMSDLRSIIVASLMGGGTDPKDAHALIDAHLVPRPINEAWMLAIDILNATFYGKTTETETENAN